MGNIICPQCNAKRLAWGFSEYIRLLLLAMALVCALWIWFMAPHTDIDSEGYWSDSAPTDV